MNPNIVAFLGKAGSGKDTAADYLVGHLGYQKIALADPMKRFCAEVFGFTKEQLWSDSRFRNQPDRRYMRASTYLFPNTPPGSIWVPLSNNQGFTLIDQSDFETVTSYKWQRNKKEEGKKTDYVRGYINGKKVSLHRFLMTPSEDQVVDHINGDGLDNRRKNLRVCSKGENRQNSSKRKDGESPFKGVGWSSKENKWRAFIGPKGEYTHLGFFDTEEEAALAYDKAAKEKFGDYARLNQDIFLTPRHALQQLGTNWGRACYEDMWVEYLLRVARKLLRHTTSWEYTQEDGLEFMGMGRVPPTGIVVPDCRFLNEVTAMMKNGGQVYRLVRGVDGSGLTQQAAQHKSETEQNNIPDSMLTGVIQVPEGKENFYKVLDEIFKRT